MKILITGVYGVVGSFLSKELSRKHEIIGIGKKHKFDGCQKYYSCDITSKETIESVLKENLDIDIIIHCAALAHNKGNDLSKDRFMKVNYEATQFLIDLSNKYLRLSNFIFISTISVYGEELDKDIYREVEDCNPKSPYAIAKKKSEGYIIDKCESNYTILRLAPVYSKDFTLNIERRSKIKGIFYRVGNGKQKISLCNIKNIGSAIDYIVENHDVEKKEIYNIADEEIYDFNDLLHASGCKNSKIIIPKFTLRCLNLVNTKLMKKEFVHENTIKLISDNIYSSEKISIKVKMKYNMKDIE